MIGDETDENWTRRTVLATVGTGATATGIGAGREPRGRDRVATDGGAELEAGESRIRIEDCYSATVRTRHPDAELVYAGLYFRETDRYDFHQARVEFPHTLDLREFDWARAQGAVLTDVSVQRIDFETLAEASVPDEWHCEESDRVSESDR